MSRLVGAVATLATLREGTSDLQPEVPADPEIFALAGAALSASSAKATDTLVQASPGTLAGAAAKAKVALAPGHRQHVVESVAKDIQELAVQAHDRLSLPQRSKNNRREAPLLRIVQ